MRVDRENLTLKYFELKDRKFILETFELSKFYCTQIEVSLNKDLKLIFSYSCHICWVTVTFMHNVYNIKLKKNDFLKLVFK